MKFRLDDDTCRGIRGVGCLADISWTTVAFDSERSLSQYVSTDAFWRVVVRESEREREKERERERNTHTRLINFGYNVTMSLCTELREREREREREIACVRACVCVCVCVWIWWTYLASLNHLASPLLHWFIYFSTVELRRDHVISEKLISLLGLIKINRMKQ